MERFNFSNLQINPDDWDDYTGESRWNAVYTVQLGELIENGIFSWDNDLLNWKDAAYDNAQYDRLCRYFIERFYYREISIEPFREWAVTLHRKIVYELMPAFIPLYEMVKDGINPLSITNEYYKNRTIDSAYPQTLLSGNSDYVTDGRDEEYEKIIEGPFVDSMLKYAANAKLVDEMVLDKLETLFISMYTLNVNSSW